MRGEGEGRTGERGASRNEKTRKNGKKNRDRTSSRDDCNM